MRNAIRGNEAEQSFLASQYPILVNRFFLDAISRPSRFTLMGRTAREGMGLCWKTLLYVGVIAIQNRLAKLLGNARSLKFRVSLSSSSSICSKTGGRREDGFFFSSSGEIYANGLLFGEVDVVTRHHQATPRSRGQLALDSCE